MAEALNRSIAFAGIDIGKNSFHVVGLDERGAIVLRQKWARARRQDCSHHQNQQMVPTGCSEPETKRRQRLAKDVRNGIARSDAIIIVIGHP
ncbi:hypothetical protein V1282_005763 [Nitrobacteraceae bacterium AZCC 2146]